MGGVLSESDVWSDLSVLSPAGLFPFTKTESIKMDRAVIDQFEAGGQELVDAVAGLKTEELTRPMEPGRWSIQKLVIHLAGADSIAIDRMKRVITEEQPLLLYAHESAYVDRLHCDQQSIEDAVELFRIGRRQIARVLRLLPDESFERAGTHSIVGVVSLADLIETYVDHLTHHLNFLLEKKAALAKQAASDWSDHDSI